MNSIRERLETVTRLFVDKAPIIFFIEKNPKYFPIVETVFELIDNGKISVVTSPITLAECLIHPFRLGLAQFESDFRELILEGPNTLFMPINEQVGIEAARIRARTNLTLPDALQASAAIHSACDALLTNDYNFKKLDKPDVILLEEFIF